MSALAEKRAILEVRSGSLAGRRVVLAAGQTLRVGRTDVSSLIIPQDPHLEAAHFELGWDGSRCLLRDLSAHAGTLCGGEATREAQVSNGDWLRAGETDFSVYFEDHTRPPKGLPPLDPTREKALAALSPELEKGTLFAIVDAARTDRIRTLLNEAVDEHRSLHDGIEADMMADVAPYLIRFQKDSRLFGRLILEGWGQSWGIYFSCPQRFRDVRAHVQQLLFVKIKEDDRILQFRFYDPRVLRVFLPTCSVRQEGELYKDIERFLCEDEGGEVLSFSRAKRAAEG